MITKNEIKFLQSLHLKKYRELHNCFLVEGRKIVKELIASQFEISIIYATNEWICNNNKVENVKVEEVTEDELTKIATHKNPDQVVAVAKTPSFSLPDTLGGQKYVLLDNINDPGNAGTIIRSADWFGWDGVIFSDESVEIFNPKVINSAKGSLFRIPVFQGDIADFLNRNKDFTVYGAMMDGTSIYEQSFVEKAIVVIGNEANGISPKISPFIRHAITIPRVGSAESLNAGVAASIIFSHWKSCSK